MRNAVALANRMTQKLDLQEEFTHEAWIGTTGSKATPVYATGVSIKALIEQGSDDFRTSTGEVITVKAVMNVLEIVTPNGAANRHEPFDPRDRITLPDGTTGTPIEGLKKNLLDPSTGRPYLHTVGLG